MEVSGYRQAFGHFWLHCVFESQSEQLKERRLSTNRYVFVCVSIQWLACVCDMSAFDKQMGRVSVPAYRRDTTQ